MDEQVAKAVEQAMQEMSRLVCTYIIFMKTKTYLSKWYAYQMKSLNNFL